MEDKIIINDKTEWFKNELRLAKLHEEFMNKFTFDCKDNKGNEWNAWKDSDSPQKVWDWVEQQIKAIPVELPVGMPEPNPQLFTIKEVEGFLQEQRRLCRDIAYNVWDKWQTMECVMNAPPPQEFIDKIIVKST